MPVMQLTHANLNQVIDVPVLPVATWYWSESQKCTLICSVAATVVPVKESQAQVREAYVKGLHSLAALQGTKTAGQEVANTAQDPIRGVQAAGSS